ncbi:MAG: hypothetical protein ABH833_03690 [Parcubacteria group bacterium]
MALYNDVINVAKNYLGIAAKEYIERRCRIAFKIELQELTEEHLERLADTIELTATAYISEEKVKKFKNEILELKNQ